MTLKLHQGWEVALIFKSHSDLVAWFGKEHREVHTGCIRPAQGFPQFPPSCSQLFWVSFDVFFIYFQSPVFFFFPRTLLLPICLVFLVVSRWLHKDLIKRILTKRKTHQRINKQKHVWQKGFSPRRTPIFLYLLRMVLVQLLIGWLSCEWGCWCSCMPSCTIEHGHFIRDSIQLTNPLVIRVPRTADSRSMDLWKSWVKFPVCHENWTVYTIYLEDHPS